MRHLCRTLQRHGRTIKDWMAGKAVIPPWAVAALRLQALEFELMRDQMGLTALERDTSTTVPLHVIKPRPAANDALFAHQFTMDIRAI